MRLRHISAASIVIQPHTRLEAARGLDGLSLTPVVEVSGSCHLETCPIAPRELHLRLSLLLHLSSHSFCLKGHGGTVYLYTFKWIILDQRGASTHASQERTHAGMKSH